MGSPSVFYPPFSFVSKLLGPHHAQSVKRTRHSPVNFQNRCSQCLNSLKKSRPLNAERTTFGNTTPSIRALGMLAWGHVVIKNNNLQKFPSN